MAKKRTVTGTWQDLKLTPAQLVRLCIDGKAKVVGVDRFERKVWEVEASVIRSAYRAPQSA